jgi:hypothetical protein
MLTRVELGQDGPSIRVGAFAQLLGVSRDKLYDDAARGELIIQRVRCGQRYYGYIERCEALRYVAAIGFGR